MQSFMRVTVLGRVVSMFVALFIQGYAMGEQAGTVGKPDYRPTQPAPGTYPRGMSPTPPGGGGRVPANPPALPGGNFPGNTGNIVRQGIYTVRVTHVPASARDWGVAEAVGFVWANPEALRLQDGNGSPLVAYDSDAQTKAVLMGLLKETVADSGLARDPTVTRYSYLRCSSGAAVNDQVRIVWPDGDARGPKAVQYVSDKAVPAGWVSETILGLAGTPLQEKQKVEQYDWAVASLRESPLKQQLVEAGWHLVRFEADKHWQTLRTVWTATVGDNEMQMVLCYGQRGSLIEISGRLASLASDSDARMPPASPGTPFAQP